MGKGINNMVLIKSNTHEAKELMRVLSHTSPIEKKVVMAIANTINKVSENDIEYHRKKSINYSIEIPVIDLAEKTNTTYKSLSNICNRIVRHIIVMEIPYTLKTTGKTELFKSHEAVFTGAGISNNIFRIKVNSDVLPLFSRTLKIYRHYNIIDAKFLTHKHSIELYKFLKDKLNYGKSDFKITLEKLRYELGLENKYKQWNHFKVSVLEKAKNDMQANGFIYFNYKEIKHSRSVAELHFTIHIDMDKKLTLYSSERLKTYLKTETKTQFKKDFEAFLNESETYKPKLKGLLIELENKSSLSEYDKNTQLEFINFIEPNLL